METTFAATLYFRGVFFFFFFLGYGFKKETPVKLWVDFHLPVSKLGEGSLLLLTETLVAPPAAAPRPAAGSSVVRSSEASCRLLRLQVFPPAVTCDPLAAQTASRMLLLETRRCLHRGHVLLLPNFNKRGKPSVRLCTRERENITICWDKSYLVNTFALLKLDSKCFVLFFLENESQIKPTN